MFSLILLCLTSTTVTILPLHAASLNKRTLFSCSFPKLTNLLSHIMRPFGRTKWGVCPKHSSKEEWRLVNELVNHKKVGLGDYLQHKQRCKMEKLIFSEEEEGEGGDRTTEVLRHFPLGTFGELRMCSGKGTLSANTTLNMCRVCEYEIILPERYFPREHLHVTCDNKMGDYSCLTGSGVCVMNNQPTLLLYDEYGHGRPGLAMWVERYMDFTKSCSCQVIKGDPMEKLVDKSERKREEYSSSKTVVSP